MANEIKRANDAARKRITHYPRALSARYVPEIGSIVVELSSGLGVAVRPSVLEGFERVSADDLSCIEITPSGFGLHFPIIDADIYLPGLLDGRFGSARYMAAMMGSRGGQARSPAKADASRRNGRLGGRPRTRQAEHA